MPLTALPLTVQFSWTLPPFCIAKVPMVTHWSEPQSWFTRYFHGLAEPPGLIT